MKIRIIASIFLVSLTLFACKQTEVETNNDLGYKVANDQVTVYGREYKESETYNFDTNVDELEENDIDVIKNGIIPPYIETKDNVKKMIIQKDCRFVWRVDNSTYTPFFANNLKGCKNLEQVEVEDGNDSLSSEDGILYKLVKNRKSVYACPMKRRGVVKLPEKVDCIWACAFYGCDQITEVEISNSVRGIGNHAFGNMQSCKSIKAMADNPYYTSEDGVLYTKNMKILVAFPAGKKIEKFVIPEGVEYISEGAYSCVEGVKEIIFPKSLKEICNYAFYSCKNIKTVKARGNIKKIGAYAFFQTPTPPNMEIPRKKGKDNEESTEWRKIVDAKSVEEDFAWVHGYGFGE